MILDAKKDNAVNDRVKCPTLCSMLEIISKFDDVGNCLYMFEMFYPLVL